MCKKASSRRKSRHGFRQSRSPIAIPAGCSTGWTNGSAKRRNRRGSEVQNLSDQVKANEARMEKLVSTYLDGDVPKEMYLKRKDALMRVLAALKEQKKDFERGRKNWVEPLREWILDTKQADFLTSSSDLLAIKSFVQKIGTNPTLRCKSPHFEFTPPSQFAAERRALLLTPAPSARASSHLSDSEVSFCGVY